MENNNATALYFQKPGRDKLIFLLIFSFVLIRFCYYGFHYNYQLDDYIQYHNYTVGTQNPLKLMTSLGLWGNRPLAWLADLLVWSRFFPVMILGAAPVSALFAASACLFRWVFARHFGTSYLFCAVYALLPLGFEGTYWMSAATRIVAGLFFTALTLYEFEKWCESGKVLRLVLFIVCQLLSCGFYEQVLILSVVAVLLLAALNLKPNRRRALCGLAAIVNAGIYFVFVAYFSHNTIFSGRGDLIRPTSGYYWHTVFPDVLRQVKHAFLGGGYYTLVKGLGRGVQLLLADLNFLYIAVLLVLAVLLFLFMKASKSQAKNPVTGLIAGLLLTLAPVSIFFLLANSWLSLRGTVASFCGLALIADILFTLLFGRRKAFHLISAGAAAVFAVVCCVASVSELHDYRETTRQDLQFVQLLDDALTSDGLMRKELRVGILNLEATYLEDQNYYYHEHIHGVTESGWSLHGALESTAGYFIPDLETLPQKPMYAPWDSGAKQLNSFSALYLYSGGGLIRVAAIPAGAGRYDIFTADGRLAGHAWEEDRYGYLSLEPGF
ncbi:hypothetical protein SAMN02745823_01230 [Sporobacter termitidis DSM 10068]|uniref:Glucosyl transferase GtrII n=1 Tax=Sporobacter termitidis DSM 10068 TaxID=1123282 RepID=A0A1M5WEM9_9FIRM|nr:glucosyltransferase domain-containing protein [Sporobacter termitidis]SHH85956.1 hypothetical protein SAMN02745823_01230 [Sporobacter termitidis DSM 10068]